MWKSILPGGSITFLTADGMNPAAVSSDFSDSMDSYNSALDNFYVFDILYRRKFYLSKNFHRIFLFRSFCEQKEKDWERIEYAFYAAAGRKRNCEACHGSREGMPSAGSIPCTDRAEVHPGVDEVKTDIPFSKRCRQMERVLSSFIRVTSLFVSREGCIQCPYIEWNRGNTSSLFLTTGSLLCFLLLREAEFFNFEAVRANQ